MDDRNGETFLQGKILWLENHLVSAEHDMERQAKHEDDCLLAQHTHAHPCTQKNTQHRTPEEIYTDVEIKK